MRAHAIVLGLSAILIGIPMLARADGAELAQARDICEQRVRQAVVAARALDWPQLADALDASTIHGIEDWGRKRGLDRTGILAFFLDVAHPGRYTHNIGVHPVDGQPVLFRVTLTGPYTYSDETQVVPASPCGYKPVELCVQLVSCPDGASRIKLAYAVHDLIYLLQ